MDVLDMLDLWSCSSSSSWSSSSSLSSSSLSDEEVVEAVPRRQPRARDNPLETLDEADFRRRYRLPRALVMELLQEIGARLEPPSNRNAPLSAVDQLLLCLRFYAVGSLTLDAAKKATACRVVRRVTHHIALLRPKYVCLPQTERAVADCKLQFHALAGFPGVLGVLGGTHVRIQSPGGQGAEVYRNPEGHFSLNVQLVVNARLEICDVVARWQGSVPDGLVFNASHLCARFQAGEMPGGHLLGGGAYPCRSYLLTPFVRPAGGAQRRYNAAHERTRGALASAVGSWKRRFPCLTLGMRTKLETTAAVVVATAVLHNMAVRRGEDLPQDSYTVASYQGVPPQDTAEGKAARMHVVNTFFT